MANYPSVVQAYGSHMSESDGTVIDRTVSGKPRFRSYFTATQKTLRLVHDLDDTDKGLIVSHYAADKLNSFTVTFDGDGANYTCKYADSPKYRPIRGNRWQVTVDLVVV